MGDINETLRIALEAAPLVLAVIVLSASLFMFLYLIIRVALPAMRETVEMFEAQRQSWADIFERQTSINQRLADELKADIKLESEARRAAEARIAELEKAVAQRDNEIAKLKAQIAQLEAANKVKDKTIDQLRADLTEVTRDRDNKQKERDELKAEYDELKKRIDALEAKKDDAAKSTG